MTKGTIASSWFPPIYLSPVYYLWNKIMDIVLHILHLFFYFYTQIANFFNIVQVNSMTPFANYLHSYLYPQTF